MPAPGVAVVLQLVWVLPSWRASAGDVTLHAEGMPPMLDARYELVDDRGELGEVIARGRVMFDGGCDGDCSHDFNARYVVRPRRPSHGVVLAFGPITRGAPRATVISPRATFETSSDGDTHAVLVAAEPDASGAIEMAAVDLDGDGVADLTWVARVCRGSTAGDDCFELRQRTPQGFTIVDAYRTITLGDESLEGTP